MAPKPTERSDDLYAIVRALRREELPRNRHFELHATPEVRAARRLHRFLRGVEKDVRRATEVRVAPRPGGPPGSVRLELRHAALRARRTIDLDAHAHALLLEDSDVASALRPLQRA
jgi:hypothetical protein